MSQVGIIRENAILPMKAGQDMTGGEGRPVLLFDGEVFIHDDPLGYPTFGVLLKGAKAGETVSVAVAAGGLAGTVRVKLGANATAGDLLQVVTDGAPFYGAYGPENTAIERHVSAQALESGLAGEKIEAALFKSEHRLPATP